MHMSLYDLSTAVTCKMLSYVCVAINRTSSVLSPGVRARGAANAKSALCTVFPTCVARGGRRRIYSRRVGAPGISARPARPARSRETGWSSAVYVRLHTAGFYLGRTYRSSHMTRLTLLHTCIDKIALNLLIWSYEQHAVSSRRHRPMKHSAGRARIGTRASTALCAILTRYGVGAT